MPLQQCLIGIVKVKHLDKKQYLLKKGAVCGNVYFIRSGLLYRYHIERDTMIISGVMAENDTVYTVPGFCNQRPSHEFIRAVVPTELYYISYDELRSIQVRFPEFHLVCHEISVYCHTMSDRRSEVLLLPHTGDRLKYMWERQPDIVARLPDNLLAAYMGCTPQNLSRIKSKLYQ
ncbi:MAG TPA: Crp/Fnr family transcriptional regulator [Chitinophagaceae bacterium]